jgi:hypothetical protein
MKILGIILPIKVVEGKRGYHFKYEILTVFPSCFVVYNNSERVLVNAKA